MLYKKISELFCQFVWIRNGLESLFEVNNQKDDPLSSCVGRAMHGS